MVVELSRVEKGRFPTRYGRQAEDLMRNRITHITKLEFLPCFERAFDAVITKDNIQGGFRGASLVPLNPEAVPVISVSTRLPDAPSHLSSHLPTASHRG
jgi:hypothetical protein